MKNSLLHPDYELHFGSYKPEDVANALDVTEKLARDRLAAIIQIPGSKRTYDNTVLALTRSSIEFDTVISVVSHLEGVLGDVWREAEQQASERLTKLSNDIGLNTDLYRALVQVRSNPAVWDNLSTARQKLLDTMIKDYKRGGITLPKAKREELRAINEQLARLSTLFAQNVVIQNDKANLHLHSKEELAGIDAEDIEHFAKEAKAKHKTGYLVSFSEPNLVNIMTNCHVRKTRRAMYRMIMSRSRRTNQQISQDIVELRQKRARLVGYANYADLAADDRMTKKSAVAVSFVDKLIGLYTPTALKEFHELQDFARRHENNPRLKLNVSDIDSHFDLYYASLLRKQSIGLDERQLREYLVLDHVRDVMFDTLSKLYGIKFERVNQPTWHESVEIYTLHDSQDRHIATVWCDWFARKGKRNGAWMDSFYVAERFQQNYKRPHLGFVCSNFDPPRGNRPALLTLHDAETVWHEFGHFVHMALNATELIEQSSMHCRWDFVEAPSQIMENWVWEPEILRKFARHYKTNQPLSDELINKLQAARNFRVATKAIRQLCLAKCDLLIHSTYDPSNDGNIVDYCRLVKTSMYPTPAASFDAFITNFLHIFAGGYFAGYYSYKWAESIQTDLFSRFKSEGILNPKVGHDYATKILAQGAEREPQELIRDFLGRDSTPQAMLERDGVAPV